MSGIMGYLGHEKLLRKKYQLADGWDLHVGVDFLVDYIHKKLYTLFFYNIETQKKGPSLILPSSIARNSSEMKNFWNPARDS